jgi:arabinose-5-phosphate isomerase
MLKEDVCAQARWVVEAEGAAVMALAQRIDAVFEAVVRVCLGCAGRVVVTGVGKSGLVGQKISATLASTGTPSLFMHASEALHGDLGRLAAGDVLIALSNSGETSEVLALLGPAKALGVVLVGVTGVQESTLFQKADHGVWIGPVQEACPMGLVPTVSSTLMLVWGDALAMTLFKMRGYGPKEYARYHPAGALGRKLMLVKEVMRQGAANPVVSAEVSLKEALKVMTLTEGRPGAVSLVDAQGVLVGFFTDGDVRRLLGQEAVDLAAPVSLWMTQNPKTLGPEAWVDEAAQLFERYGVDQLPVVDQNKRPVGFLDVQDLLKMRPL